MFVKMGFKKWTKGTQAGLRIYTDSINKLSSILEFPSRDKKWRSLRDFLHAIELLLGRTSVLPYSRNLQIIDSSLSKKLSATMTIAQHNHSTQGYITVPSGTWLGIIVEKFMNRNFYFEYISEENIDLLVLPDFKLDIRKKRKNELNIIEEEVYSKSLRKSNVIPFEANIIGLYFELEEVKYISEKEKLVPSHRFPNLNSKLPKIAERNISCDIDVCDNQGHFVKFVEVKSVYGLPVKEFNLTINEYKSREICCKNRWEYEIVVYYHIGKQILKRLIITPEMKLITRPSGYWCIFKKTG
jgi:hypothetical protein